MRPEIVLYGDSITAQSFGLGGWGAALADTYSRKADVLVRGYGGYNTRWALFLLHHIFPLNSPKAPIVVTIFFGANDAAILGRTSEKQHVPLEEYKYNLKKMVNHLKEYSPTTLVILITPPPVDEEGRNEYARSLYGDKARELPERTNEVTGLYAKECLELAKEIGLHAIDLWSKMQETEGWQKKFLRDGLHFTPEGNGVLHQELEKVLNETSVAAAKMPLDFPHHSKIDGKNPEKAFQLELRNFASWISSHSISPLGEAGRRSRWNISGSLPAANAFITYEMTPSLREELCKVHGTCIQQNSRNLLPALKSLQMAITRTYQDVVDMCSSNEYLLRYLCSTNAKKETS